MTTFEVRILPELEQIVSDLSFESAVASVSGINLDGVVVHAGIERLALGAIAKVHPKQADMYKTRNRGGSSMHAKLEIERLEWVVRVSRHKRRRKGRDNIEVTHWPPTARRAEVSLVTMTEIVAHAETPERHPAICRYISEIRTGAERRNIFGDFDIP